MNPDGEGTLFAQRRVRMESIERAVLALLLPPFWKLLQHGFLLASCLFVQLPRGLLHSLLFLSALCVLLCQTEDRSSPPPRRVGALRGPGRCRVTCSELGRLPSSPPTSRCRPVGAVRLTC